MTEKSERFVVNVYNSLSRNIDRYIRVPMPDQSTSHQVFDSKGIFDDLSCKSFETSTGFIVFLQGIQLIFS